MAFVVGAIMGGQSGQSSGTSGPTGIPVPIRKLINQSGKGWLEGLQAAEGQGGLASLLAAHPEQIAGLTPDEMGNISQLEGWASGNALTPAEQQAQGAYSRFLDTTPGNSPATQAAMRNWQMNVAPTISSGLAASGGGRGGELAAALQSGQTAAYTPLAAADEQNQLTAASGLSGLGQLQTSNVQNAMSASDQIRQIQQAQDTSNYNDFLRRSGLIQNYIQGPMSQFFPATVGQQSSSSTSQGGKF